MNILGMGPMEILLIVVLALIVFGPAKLPEMMGQVGKAIADFRRATSQLSDEFNRTIQAELQETRALVDDTKSTVTGVNTSINSAITGTPAPVLTAVPGGVPSGTSTQATINGTNGTASPPVTPPLADTSQWSWETAAPAPAKPTVEVVSSEQVGVAETQASPPPADVPAPSLTPPAKPRKPARDDLRPPY
jgi:TatA/E family protein of Tat protein translocase